MNFNIGTVLGIALIIFGLIAFTKGDISAIYGYKAQLNGIPKEDMPSVSKKLGLWVIVMGIGCALLPNLNTITGSGKGFIIGVIIIAIGYLGFIFTIKKHNAH